MNGYRVVKGKDADMETVAEIYKDRIVCQEGYRVLEVKKKSTTNKAQFAICILAAIVTTIVCRLLLGL